MFTVNRRAKGLIGYLEAIAGGSTPQQFENAFILGTLDLSAFLGADSLRVLRASETYTSADASQTTFLPIPDNNYFVLLQATAFCDTLGAAAAGRLTVSLTWVPTGGAANTSTDGLVAGDVTRFSSAGAPNFYPTCVWRPVAPIVLQPGTEIVAQLRDSSSAGSGVLYCDALGYLVPMG